MMQRSLSERLRVLRARRGLSLTEAAERAGVTRDTISDLERGKRRAYMPTLTKIARGYKVPVEELLEEPVPLAEAPEAGPATERGDLPQASREAPEETGVSEADRRYLAGLLDPWTKLFRELNEAHGPFLRIKLPDAPSDKERQQIYSWLGAFVDVCSRMERRLLDNPPFAEWVDPWLKRINEADEAVPDEIREMVLSYDAASTELFDELLPLAEDWMVTQGKRATAEMLDELTADIGRFLEERDKPRRDRS